MVYLDELCLLNFAVNLLLLFATARLGGCRARPGRLCLGAAAGAVYAAVVLLPGLGWAAGTAVKLAAAGGMCLLAFGGERRLPRCFVLFLALAFSFGGVICALSLWRYGGASLSAALLYAPVELPLLLSAGAVCLGAFLLLFGRLAAHGGPRGGLLPVRLSLDGRTVILTALLDTGNCLTDPLSGAPVLVAEYETLLPLLPPEIRPAVDARALAAPAALMERLAGTTVGTRLRLIPYRSVGRTPGLLLALRPDRAAVGRDRSVSLAAAFSPTPLSDGGIYRAVLGGVTAQEKRRHPL